MNSMIWYILVTCVLGQSHLYSRILLQLFEGGWVGGLPARPLLGLSRTTQWIEDEAEKWIRKSIILIMLSTDYSNDWNKWLDNHERSERIWFLHLRVFQMQNWKNWWDLSVYMVKWLTNFCNVKIGISKIKKLKNQL